VQDDLLGILKLIWQWSVSNLLADNLVHLWHHDFLVEEQNVQCSRALGAGHVAEKNTGRPAANLA
jgi:hypothetical protein